MRYSAMSVAAAGLLMLTACEIPKAPQWDVEVLIPYSSDTVTVADLLPSTITLDTVGGTPVFQTQPMADSVEFRLGQMCSQCLALNGQTVQVPAFQYTDSLDVPFPPSLVTIDVTSALLEIRVTNGLAFDPLKPDPDPADAGYIALVQRDLVSGTTIDSVVISGGSETLAPGETRVVRFSITDKQISEGVRVVVHVVAPQDGQTVTIDTTQATKVAVSLGNIQVGGVAVVVDSVTLDEQAQSRVNQTVRDVVARTAQGGQFELLLQHDLDLAGDFRASIGGSTADLFSGDPMRDIQLNRLVLTPGVLHTRELTADQIRQIASFEQVLIGFRAIVSGTQTGPSGQSSVARFTPEQFLYVNLQLRSVRRVEF